MAGALLYHPKVAGEKLIPGPFQTHPAAAVLFYSVYECADGNWVQLGCVHVGFIATRPRSWAIKDVIDQPQSTAAPLPRTLSDQDLRAIVAQGIRSKPYAEGARLSKRPMCPSPSTHYGGKPGRPTGRDQRHGRRVAGP